MNKIDPEIFNRLRQLLTDLTDNDIEEVVPDADLEEDLGLDLDVDTSRLVDHINKEFDINLNEKNVYKELTENAHASVAELAKLVYDEYELG
jgi:acyl carrier protein